jgi:hypothetical protein
MTLQTRFEPHRPAPPAVPAVVPWPAPPAAAAGRRGRRAGWGRLSTMPPVWQASSPPARPFTCGGAACAAREDQGSEQHDAAANGGEAIGWKGCSCAGARRGKIGAQPGGGCGRLHGPRLLQVAGSRAMHTGAPVPQKRAAGSWESRAAKRCIAGGPARPGPRAAGGGRAPAWAPGPGTRAELSGARAAAPHASGAPPPVWEPRRDVLLLLPDSTSTRSSESMSKDRVGRQNL